ncbi:MAG: glycosyltransferase family 39 protein [Acidobacteriia bacterium]|nr:glycosyltransferase family 39 protein [Terriglobia bacterium]
MNPSPPALTITEYLGRQSPSASLLRRPEASPRDLAVACGVAAFAVFWVQPFVSYFGVPDEGIILQGAVRILRGEVPYRDFFSFFTPGSYYFYALLFRVFGTSIQVARTVLVAYAALYAFLTYLLARRACSRPASLLSACLLTLICLARFAVVHNWDSTTAALLTLYCAVWLLQTEAAPWAFLCGLCAGATTMIEQSKGAGLLLGLAIAGLALYRLDRGRWKLRHAAWMVLGAALPVVAVIGYFASHHALGPMFAAWLWPLQHYTVVNKLPYGYMQGIEVREAVSSLSPLERGLLIVSIAPMVIIALLPLLVLGLWAATTGRALLGKVETTPLAKFVALSGSVLLGVFLATLATNRPDFYRILYIAPLFVFAMPLLLDSRLVPLPSLSNLQPLVAVVLLVSFTLCDLVLGSNAWQARNVIDTRRGAVKSNKTEEIVPYLQAHVAAGEKVMVYPYLPLYSFLSATSSPTQFDFVQVGMHTPAQFEAARRQLEQDRTAVVLFDLTFRDVVTQWWPSTPAEALASDPMGDFIFSHYRPCKTLVGAFRPFEYMVRKDLPCPR